MGIGDLNFPLSVGIIPDDLPHRRNLNGTGQGIFNAEQRSGNHRLHLGFFKAQVSVLHLTVNKRQVLAVAEGLGTLNFAAD